jgi:hypothetical protein
MSDEQAEPVFGEFALTKLAEAAEADDRLQRARDVRLRAILIPESFKLRKHNARAGVSWIQFGRFAKRRDRLFVPLQFQQGKA